MSHTLSARLVYNTGFALSATLLDRFAQVFLFVLVSRLAGPDEAGILTIGLSYLTLAIVFSTWGLDQILIRDVAPHLAQTGRYFTNFLSLRLTLAIIVALLLAVLLPFLPYPPKTVWLIYLLTLNVIPEGILNLCQAVFTAHEQISFVTLSRGTLGGLKLLFGLTALTLGYGLTGLVVSLLLAGTITSLATLIFVFHRFGLWRFEANFFASIVNRKSKIQNPFDLGFCARHLKIALAFAVIGGLYILDNQLDVMLISWQLGPAQVGLYGAALVFITGLGVLPRAYHDAVFPRLSLAYNTHQAGWQHLYRQSYKYLLVGAVAAATGLLLLARPLLLWLYGPGYEAAVPALQLLAISGGIFFLFILHNRLLIIAHQQSKIAMFLMMGLTLNIILNLSLVPVWGITGAALAKLASNLLVFGLLYRTVFNQIYAFQAQPIWLRVMGSGLVMAVFLVLFNAWPVWMLVSAGALIYGVSLLALGVFSKGEILAWLGLLKLAGLTQR